MTDPTEARIAEIRARWKDITDAYWDGFHDNMEIAKVAVEDDIPWLLAEVDRLRAELKEVHTPEPISAKVYASPYQHADKLEVENKNLCAENEKLRAVSNAAKKVISAWLMRGDNHTELNGACNTLDYTLADLEEFERDRSHG